MTGYWGTARQQKWAVALAWEMSPNGNWFPHWSWTLDSDTDSGSGWLTSLQEAPDLIPKLMFDPTLEAHRLRSATFQEPERIRNAKVILDALTSGNSDRECRCWQMTPLELLRERGVHTGLTEYMLEVQEHLVPLLE